MTNCETTKAVSDTRRENNPLPSIPTPKWKGVTGTIGPTPKAADHTPADTSAGCSPRSGPSCVKGRAGIGREDHTVVHGRAAERPARGYEVLRCDGSASVTGGCRRTREPMIQRAHTRPEAFSATMATSRDAPLGPTPEPCNPNGRPLRGHPGWQRIEEHRSTWPPGELTFFDG